MKLVQILVCILLLKGGYDVLWSLLNKSEGLPTAVQEATAQWESVFGFDKVIIKPSTEWLIGGFCVALVYALRQITRWIVPKPVDLAKKLHDAKTVSPRRRESFLTCRISDTTINTYSDENSYEIPGQLSTSQLQVLLEELKFSVDEKFDEIESWMGNNEQELKLWLKRLERVETELSYIRHQIFILMSSNAKLGSSLSIGDVSDSRGHVETLKDLSNILAQVKKQFNEDEAKGKKKGDEEEAKGKKKKGDEEEAKGKKKKVEEEVKVKKKKGDEDSNEKDLKKVEKGSKPSSVHLEQKKSVTESLRERETVKITSEDDSDEILDLDELKPKAREILNSAGAKGDRVRHLQNTESIESDIRSVSFGNKEDLNSLQQLEKNAIFKYERPESKHNRSSSRHGPEGITKRSSSRQGPEGITKRSSSRQGPEDTTKRSSSRQEGDVKSRSLSPPSARKREDAGDYPSSRKSSRSPDRNKSTILDNYLEANNINDESTTSTNLLSMKYDLDPFDLDSMMIKEVSPRSSSPRRSVRFAQEQREVSPSKTPTWLGIDREQPPVKTNEIKGGSDSKVISSFIEVRGNKENLSCPNVEDKRPSRRTMLEKELNRLERRASPSPPRTRHGRRPNVRSKVAEYIRGNKNIY